MIDNYIMDQSPRITMTLSEILANTPPVQTLAQATDVPGANLEWMKTAAYPTGAWFGDLGELGTTAFRDSLFTGYLARGVTCKVSGVPYSWSGSAWEVAVGVNVAAIPPYRRASGESCKFWLVGSSTTSRCSTLGVDPSASTQEFNEFTDGYWFAVKSRYSCGWTLGLNSGAEGYTTEQSYTKMISDTPPTCSHVVLQLNANDLPHGTCDYVNAGKCVNLGLSKGLIVILVVPHMRAGATNHADYDEYEAWCYLQETRFPSSVFVVSHYAAFGKNPIDPQYSTDGVVHLNAIGSYIAASAWEGAVKKISGSIMDEMDAFGKIAYDFDLSAGTNTGCTVSKNTDGTYTVTSSQSISTIASPSFTISTSKKYRMFCDYTVVTSTLDVYAAGARVYIGGIPKRFGIRNWSDQTMKVSAGRFIALGDPFTPGSTSAVLTFFPGGYGSICRVKRFGLIELP